MREGRRERLAQLLPNETDLVRGLSTVLGSRGEVLPIEVLDRQLNTFSSSHPSEVVRYRLRGAERTILLKYGREWERHPHIARRGVAYEAAVYENLLHPHGISSPGFVGAGDIGEGDATWLAIEFIDNCQRLDNLDDAVLTAAEWLGRFHAYSERTWRPVALPYLKVFDAEYNRYWIDGAVQRLALLAREHDWIPVTMDKVRRFVDGFSTEPAVFLHGEFYPHNILVRDGTIYPIDWESSGFGCAEIDLVSLIDGWDPDMAAACKTAYRHARWGTSPPESFERSLLFAEIYWNLRWLSGLARNRPAFDPALTELPRRLVRLRENCQAIDRL